MATILVAAPVNYLRSVLTSTLQGRGHQIVEVEHFDGMAQLYADTRPQIVVLDISGAEAAGLAAIHEIRQSDPVARLVVITSLAPKRLITQALHLGASRCLVKPFTPERLLKTVQELVAPREQRRHRRVEVDLHARITVELQTPSQAPCVIEDLGAGGARCRMGFPLSLATPEPQTTVRLTFRLPQTAHTIEVAGQVLQTLRRGLIRIAFVQVPEETRALITAFCEQLAHDQRRLVGAAAARQARRRRGGGEPY